VILVDDLIATGGTAEGAVKLMRQIGRQRGRRLLIIDLPDLGVPRNCARWTYGANADGVRGALRFLNPASSRRLPNDVSRLTSSAR